MHNEENDKWFLSKVKDGTLTVSKSGKVFNNKTNRRIGATGTGRYPKISMMKCKINEKKIIVHMQIHRLVWIVHKGLIPQGFEIHHRDFNEQNPRLNNLKITTTSGNALESIKAGREWNLFKSENKIHLKRKNYGNRYKTVPNKRFRLKLNVAA